jgi:hypothetical protein
MLHTQCPINEAENDGQNDEGRIPENENQHSKACTDYVGPMMFGGNSGEAEENEDYGLAGQCQYFGEIMDGTE